MEVAGVAMSMQTQIVMGFLLFCGWLLLCLIVTYNYKLSLRQRAITLFMCTLMGATSLIVPFAIAEKRWFLIGGVFALVGLPTSIIGAGASWLGERRRVRKILDLREKVRNALSEGRQEEAATYYRRLRIQSIGIHVQKIKELEDTH